MEREKTDSCLRFGGGPLWQWNCHLLDLAYLFFISTLYDNFYLVKNLSHQNFFGLIPTIGGTVLIESFFRYGEEN